MFELCAKYDEQFNGKILAKRNLADLSLHKKAYQQGSKSTTHFHENARFVFVLRGKFSEIYERKSRECSPYMAIFRPPQESHSEDYHGKDIVCLSTDLQPGWLERLRQYNLNLTKSADFKSNNLLSLITRLNREIVNSDNVSSLAIEALMMEIAVEVYRQEKKTESKDHNPLWLNIAKDYIHARFETNLSISEIARAVNIHPVHLTRVFRQNYGCTIAEYIRRMRVELACAKLASSNDSLVEIALNSGFSDQSHFSKVFKQTMNLTPGEYRTAIKSR